MTSDHKESKARMCGLMVFRDDRQPIRVTLSKKRVRGSLFWRAEEESCVVYITTVKPRPHGAEPADSRWTHVIGPDWFCSSLMMFVCRVHKSHETATYNLKINPIHHWTTLPTLLQQLPQQLGHIFQCSLFTPFGL